jgi:hypothetical protein
MNRRSFLTSTVATAVVATSPKLFAAEAPPQTKTVRLSSLPPRLVNQGWGTLLFDRSVDGKPLQIGDRTFEHGISTHARSDLAYVVGGRYSRFRSWVGIDAAPSKAKEPTARFLVYADGTKLFDSGMMKPTTPAKKVDVDVSNVNVLRLIVAYSGAYADHANWAEAELTARPTESAVAAPTRRPVKPPQQIRSGNLVFTVAGNLLSGLQMQDGKSIKLEGSFAIGPYAKCKGDESVTESLKFSAAKGGLGLDWECTSHSHRPWTTAIDSHFRWPNAAKAKVWLPRGYGMKWQDPLIAQPFEDRTYDYGAFFNREDGLSLPMATVLDEEHGVGVTFVQSPDDVLLDLQISTTQDGEIRFSRAFHRFGGDESKTRLHMDVLVHEPDWRAGLRAIVERYPQYFEAPNAMVHQVGGGAAYSGWEGPVDIKKLSSMGFTVNWKASLDFPYMGMFIPPVNDDNEKWNRFAGGGEGAFTAQDEGRYGQTSIRQMSEYSSSMRAHGFYVLNYFNVTEFGANVTYPLPSATETDNKPIWQDANRFLHGELESAVLKTPEPIWTWGKGLILDCGDPAYRDFLLAQAKRHVEKLPDSSGIAIDRMDWLTRYNPNADDGVTWVDGPCRQMRRSWIELMEKMGPIFHDGQKVIFANDMDRRLEMMRQVDGIYDEHGHFGFNLNTSSFLALHKPLICWTPDEKPLGDDPDEYFQRHLYMGAFPMVPFPENDHSVLPNEANEKFYLDYGAMFNALRARTWILTPGVIEVVEGKVKANIFETPSQFVVIAGLGGEEKSAKVKVRGVEGPAKILLPGETVETPLESTKEDDAVIFEISLKRGCGMLLLEKTKKSENV